MLNSKFTKILLIWASNLWQLALLQVV